MADILASVLEEALRCHIFIFSGTIEHQRRTTEDS
jgi:hypothetical protein